MVGDPALSKSNKVMLGTIATAPTLFKTLFKTQNTFELLIQTSWCAIFFFPAVWVQLMKTLTVSPTQASESAACWLRDPLAEEPSIKRRITPTLTPQTTAVLSCLSSCWLGALDRDPCSCPGYLTGVHKERRRRLEIQSVRCYSANLSSVYSHMFKKLQLKTMSQPCLRSRHTK